MTLRKITFDNSVKYVNKDSISLNEFLPNASKPNNASKPRKQNKKPSQNIEKFIKNKL